jgi:hypothetical protein
MYCIYYYLTIMSSNICPSNQGNSKLDAVKLSAMVEQAEGLGERDAEIAIGDCQA